ncbi:protein FAM163B [Paramormyrops kingsleyae]|uniref:Family with sequence similarity 163 member B n=1 Tax=Paramormyrops kingsleyae TaxID=1676925 RepID=A0A3B3RSZ6_9TELE|nr:protein FAM163B-like isoform X3 [Paramormyrops kingsleyae]XP_023657077.1 protein FAM163B-like isoform X3 [Paramormyrops kingsleyae]XP_023657086.1 protein FAM163B-like isoform X3 [Paramormyrops kingsleyae]XP_023657096.1 protein FAM163B-like isoform X3 [Paramormyrops kingsleyae]XP_023657105.1 protein FAM163B-like isoform X3 [Paramormyrops kingsleyae]
MTAGTVVITGGILATVILLCIVVVLCYCRLQYYCCKREELESDSESDSEEEELHEEAIFGMTPHLPLDAVAACTANGPCVYPSEMPPRLARSHTFCPSCAHHELPFLMPRPHGLYNGAEWAGHRTVSRWGPRMAPDKLQLTRSMTMKEMFTYGHSISTDV